MDFSSSLFLSRTCVLPQSTVSPSSARHRPASAWIPTRSDPRGPNPSPVRSPPTHARSWVAQPGPSQSHRHRGPDRRSAPSPPPATSRGAHRRSSASGLGGPPGKAPGHSRRPCPRIGTTESEVDSIRSTLVETLSRTSDWNGIESD